MRKFCFVCGSVAEEEHHVVPKSLGGTKTVSLCSACHGKIHGIEGRSGHRELTMRGLDKILVDELVAVWWHYFVMEMELDDVCSELEISRHKVKRRIARLEEMTDKHIEELFRPVLGDLRFHAYTLYG